MNNLATKTIANMIKPAVPQSNNPEIMRPKRKKLELKPNIKPKRKNLRMLNTKPCETKSWKNSFTTDIIKFYRLKFDYIIKKLIYGIKFIYNKFDFAMRIVK